MILCTRPLTLTHGFWRKYYVPLYPYGSDATAFHSASLESFFITSIIVLDDLANHYNWRTDCISSQVHSLEMTAEIMLDVGWH